MTLDWTYNEEVILNMNYVEFIPCSAGTCHHGMGGSPVADGGNVSNIEGSCEYVE